MSDKKIENVFQLDGQVPLKTAIPFGLQHVLQCLWQTCLQLQLFVQLRSLL